MELKAFKENYTEDERCDFIIENNFDKGYEIRCTEKEVPEIVVDDEGNEQETVKTVKVIEAWGKSDSEILEDLKQAKYTENTTKAEKAVENGYVIYKQAQFETNTQTLNDLENARKLSLLLGDTSYNWLSRDDKIVELIIDDDDYDNDDFIQIGFLAAAYKNKIWLQGYLTYKTQIANAETIEEVNAIEIDYSRLFENNE